MSPGTSIKVLKNGVFYVSSSALLADIAKIYEYCKERYIIVKDFQLEDTTLEDVFIQLIEKERESSEWNYRCPEQGDQVLCSQICFTANLDFIHEKYHTRLLQRSNRHLWMAVSLLYDPHVEY